MKHKDNILRLRKEGKSYKQIVKTLGCSIGTIAYHCGDGQKQKTFIRHQKYKETLHPYVKRISNFSSKSPHVKQPEVSISTPSMVLLYHKIRQFCSVNKKRSSMLTTFTVQDVIDKFGENPTCYLTGQPININQTRTYHFDHILPRSRGGTNNLDNLGICTRTANQSKTDMTFDEFISFCKIVVANAKLPK